jgi:hypothetical protein
VTGRRVQWSLEGSRLRPLDTGPGSAPLPSEHLADPDLTRAASQGDNCGARSECCNRGKGIEPVVEGVPRLLMASLGARATTSSRALIDKNSSDSSSRGDATL